jgi:exonuclease 1
MGIKGLWKEVQPVCRAGHISQFRGLRVGVDTYCWLHRAVISCAAELALGKPCDKYLTFMMNRVDLLLRYGVTPVLIFDGDAMPMKQGTDADRKARRAQANEEGRRLLEQGAIDEAHRMLEKSLDVTTEIAFTVLQIMQDRGIECIVSPYEADAQLGYLIKEGYIHAVISEDSDLIVYHTGTLLAKMDSSGSCDCLYVRDLPNIPLLNQLSYESFVVGCIMSGCDYLPSLPNVGIKTAFRLVASAKSIPLLMEALRTQHGFSQRELAPYEEALHKAFYCFAHHLVYDPVRKQVVPFRPFPIAVAHQEALIGAQWDAELAVAVCRDCTVDPIAKKPYTHHHQANVDMYMKRVKGGQTSLTTFRGFEDKRAAKIVLGMAAAEASSASRRLADSPGMRGPRGDQGEMQFIGGGNGGAPLAARHTNRRQLVVSKYFHAGRADVISESDEEDVADGASRYVPVALDDGGDDTQCSTVAGSAAASPALFTVPSPLPILVEATAAAPTTGGSPPLDAGLSQSQTATSRGCPYGYPQCGQSHSIFFKCFDGRGWSKNGDGHSPTSTQPESSSRPCKRERDDDASQRAPSARAIIPTSDLATLRKVLGAPTGRPSSPAPPERSAPTTTNGFGSDGMKRLRFVPPKPIGTPTIAAAAPSTSGVSASTKAAAALFEQFAFRQ